MKELTKKQQNEYDNLSLEERKIYDSVIANFSATSHEYALDAAINGGVKFQFIPK